MITNTTIGAWAQSAQNFWQLLRRPSDFYRENVAEATPASEKAFISTAALLIFILSFFQQGMGVNALAKFGVDFGLLHGFATSFVYFTAFVMAAAGLAVVEFVGILFGGKLLFRDYLMFRVQTLFNFYLTLLLFAGGALILFNCVTQGRWTFEDLNPTVSGWLVGGVFVVSFIMFGLCAPFAVCRYAFGSALHGFRFLLGPAVLGVAYMIASTG